jgi:adenylate kinase family enzyme
VLIDGLPRTSNLARAVHGDEVEWSTADHLLALQFDALQIANWQRSKDGATGRNRPKPMPRPGLKPIGERVGRTQRTPEEVKAYLAQFRPMTEEVAGDGG